VKAVILPVENLEREIDLGRRGNHHRGAFAAFSRPPEPGGRAAMTA
jgi:hypothetical protein